MKRTEIINGVTYSNSNGLHKRIIEINGDMLNYKMVKDGTEIGDVCEISIKSFCNWAKSRVEDKTKETMKNLTKQVEKEITKEIPKDPLADFDLFNIKALYNESLKTCTLSTEQEIESYIRKKIDKAIEEDNLFVELRRDEISSWLDKDKVLQTMKTILTRYGIVTEIKNYSSPVGYKMFIYQTPSIINLFLNTTLKCSDITRVKEMFNGKEIYGQTYGCTFGNIAEQQFKELEKYIDKLLILIKEKIVYNAEHVKTLCRIEYYEISRVFNDKSILEQIYIDSKVRQYLFKKNFTISSNTDYGFFIQF
jgi:hypothetical protein